MPIYEYACPACGTTFETLIIRRSDEADVACPGCQSRTVNRQLSRTAAPRTGGSGGGGFAPPSGCGPVG